MRQLRIGLAQLNVSVGDVEGNARRVLDEIERARALGVDLVAFPELCLTGLPARGSPVQARVHRGEPACARPTWPGRRPGSSSWSASSTSATTSSTPRPSPRRGRGRRLPQAVPAELRRLRREPLLPGRDGDAGLRAGRGGPVLAVNICEDIWYPDRAHDARRRWPARSWWSRINASPYHAGQGALPREDAGHPGRRRPRVPRLRQPGRRPGRAGLRRPVHGLRTSRASALARGRAFEEDLVVADLDLDAVFRARLHDSRRRKEKLVAATPVRRVRAGAAAASGRAPPCRRGPPTFLEPVTPRCTRRSSSARATTSARTGSGTSCRALGRHRLGARGGHRRGRARARRTSPA